MSWEQKWIQDILRTCEGFDAISDVHTEQAAKHSELRTMCYMFQSLME